MRSAGLLAILLLVLQPVVAQVSGTDTVLMLDDVTIVSDRLGMFTKGQNIQNLDSLTRRENPSGALSELLTGFTSTYVRNYGQGTLTTLSVRGTSANHSGILWNGIRVAPPNIGYVDLSLIQGNFFQDISVLYGGASPMFGSGAIGGGVHLNNRPVFDTSGWNGQISLSAGSFANLLTNGSVKYSSGRIFSHSAFSVNQASNDFAYTDLSGNKESLEHAAYFKGGFLQDIAVQLPSDQYIMASAWFQYSDRGIPPTLTESESQAELMDRSWRTMLVWKDFNAANTLEAKVAYFNEFERYIDPKTDVYSVIHSQAATGAFETTWDLFPTSTLFGGVNYTYEYAELDFYNGPEDQQSLSLYLSWMQEIPSIQWKVSANARQEFMTGFRVPFLYSVGATGSIWRFVSGRLSFSRNFRAPTLNERFWVPGGNPGLEPEDSYNVEAGITLAPKMGRIETSFSVTGFSSWVNNWILWLPGAGFWSVENAQEVWSRGLELALNEDFRFGQVRLDLAGSYTLTFSTNEEKLSEYDASYKQQLIYTPEQRFMLKALAGWKGFRLTLRGNYTGTVYTTRDNEASLPPYFLLDGIVAKDFRIGKRLPLTIQLNLNNLTGEEYETVPYRPMPGFNLMATVVVAVGSRQSAVGSQQSAVSGQQAITQSP